MRREGNMVGLESQQSGLSVTKKTKLSRSWIVLDTTGQATFLGADKYAVINRVQIHARDLRILDPLLSYPSTIFGRDNAIVLNLEHIKAIITVKEVLLRDPFDENIIPVVEELKRQLPRGNVNDSMYDQNDILVEEEDDLPFEFRALEVALEAICNYLDARSMELETNAYLTLNDLTSKVSTLNLDKVRKVKSSMTNLTTKVQKVKSELEQLLGDEGDMFKFYLSKKLDGASSQVNVPIGQKSCPPIAINSKNYKTNKTSGYDDENDVEELEMILEASFSKIDNTFNRLTTLREFIDCTEDYINMQLDKHRNQLIQVELLINNMDFCISIWLLVCGIFGLSIPYTWNAPEYGYLFKWVTGSTFLFCIMVFVAITMYARMKGLLMRY